MWMKNNIPRKVDIAALRPDRAHPNRVQHYFRSRV